MVLLWCFHFLYSRKCPCLVGVVSALWGRGLWENYSWWRSFFGCCWNWPCFWLHPQIWSGFCRRVGILVFMWYGFVLLHPWSPPCIQPQMIVYIRVWIFILFGYGLYLFLFPGSIWIHLKGVFWYGKCYYDWVEPLSGPLFHPRSWISLTPIYFLLFRKNIE